MKYPVRVALNPFISTIGYALPQIVGGILITAVVLNLPILGPLLLEPCCHRYVPGRSHCAAPRHSDRHWHPISDILLVVFDPRIRLSKDTRDGSSERKRQWVGQKRLRGGA